MTTETKRTGTLVLLRPNADEPWRGASVIAVPHPERPGKLVTQVEELAGETEAELRKDGFNKIDIASVDRATVGIYTYFTETSFQGHFS